MSTWRPNHKVTLDDSEEYYGDVVCIDFNDGDGGNLRLNMMDSAPAISTPEGQSYFCFHSEEQLDLFYKQAKRFLKGNFRPVD